MIRISGGELKGVKIDTAKGMEVRPTLAKTREAIFNVLASRFDLEMFEAVDLFAGSRALGFEAVSHGAPKALFIENNKKHVSILKKMIHQLSLDDRCQVVYMDALLWMQKSIGLKGQKLFLVDPPYNANLYQKVVDIIDSQRENLDNSILVLEVPKQFDIVYPSNFSLIQKKTYGKTRIDFIEISGGAMP